MFVQSNLLLSEDSKGLISNSLSHQELLFIAFQQSRKAVLKVVMFGELVLRMTLLHNLYFLAFLESFIFVLNFKIIFYAVFFYIIYLDFKIN